jgi:hypothetical protein
MTLQPGLRAAFRYTVTEADTAMALGSGEVPVLATPRVLALAERATVAVAAGMLAAGATTVGTRVELDDLAPSPIGGLYGWARPADTASSTAVPCILLIRMRPLVQVQPGPQISPVSSGIAACCVCSASLLGRILFGMRS